MKIQNILYVLLFAIAGSPVAYGKEAPSHLILTYMGDTSTTITVNWQTFTEDAGDAVVYYDTVSGTGLPDRYQNRAKGKSFRVPGLKDRFVYRVQIRDLEPDTVYYLVAGDADSGISREIKFRTIPADDSELRFVTGGDMGPNAETRVLLHHAASFDPDFALVGGDIAYANGRLNAVDRWDSWLSYYTEEMVTSEGLTIPVVFAIGNHEVNGGYNKPKEYAPFFFNFAGQDAEKSYFLRTFGKNLAFFILDSGHISSHETQAPWLEEMLKLHQNVKYKAAIYHVPLYPSHRPFDGNSSKLGRIHWGPLFDRYEMTVAFENHDHTFKRTHLLKENKIVTNSGTLYLGDGCWGREGRSIDFKKRNYLRHAGSIQHFWVVDMDAEAAVYRAIDIDGKCFDVYPEDHSDFITANEVMSEKVHHYMIPDDVVEVKGFENPETTFTEGSGAVSVSNTFAYPLTATIEMEYDDMPYESELPVTFELKAGESKQLELKFKATEASGIPLEDLDFDVLVTLLLEHPDYDHPVIFDDDFAIYNN